MTKTNKHILESVNITCEILNSVQEKGKVGVTEISNELGYSKSTVYDHLMTLESNGLVVKEGSQYHLSLQFLEVAEQIRERIDENSIIRNELEKLATETGEVSQFGVEENGWLRYFHKATGGQNVVTSSRVGSMYPLHSTSLGKAILSQLSRDRVNEIIDQRGLSPMTTNTITDRDKLFEELDKIQEQGYAIDAEENVLGIRCVAAPVMGNESVYGAVSISGPKTRFGEETLRNELASSVIESANVIEINFKFG